MSPGRGSAAAVACAAIALTLAACDDGRVQPRADAATESVVDGAVVTAVPIDSRETAPEFSAPLLDGSGEYMLADSLGDVVVLNVWGSWCAPCRAEAPALEAVYEETKADGVAFVGVNTRDSKTAALAFEAEFAITYPSVFDPAGSALLAFRDTLPPSAIPSTLVVDREGRVAARVLGQVTERSLLKVVSDVAAEPWSGGSA